MRGIEHVSSIANETQMLTKEQLAHRKIGGSDVSVILGVNPYKSAEELRREIRGELQPFEGNEHTEAGAIMEESICTLYSRRTGRELRRSNQTVVHPKYPWLTCHFDRLVVGEKLGLEAKNVHWRSAHLWGNGGDQIAEHHLPQVMTYMLVKQYPRWDVAAYFGGSDLKLFTVEEDSEWFEIIIEATHHFWHVNVGKDVPCEIDPNMPRAIEALRRVYPGTDGLTVQASDELAQIHAAYQQFKKLAGEYETAADVARAHLLREMKTAAKLELPDGSHYSRKVVSRKAYEVAATTYVDFHHHKAKE